MLIFIILKMLSRNHQKMQWLFLYQEFSMQTLSNCWLSSCLLLEGY